MTPVYAAKYSNVPVWVSNIKNVSVMRRQGDGWVNATHLLKVADFDKPRRTRILERDVQSGEHEKVQGGYGKYQGTWIPLERAKELSEQVGILDIVIDLLDFAPQEGVVTEELPRQPKPMTVRKNASNGDSANGVGASKAKRARKSNSLPVSTPTIPARAQPMQTMPAIMDGGYAHPQQVPQWQQYPPQAGFSTPTAPGANRMPSSAAGAGASPMNYSMQGMAMPVMPMHGYPMYHQQQQSPYNQQQMMSPLQQQQMQAVRQQQQQYSQYGMVPNGSKVQPPNESAPSSPSLSSSVLSSGSDGGMSDEERPYLGGAYRLRNADGHPIDPAAAAAARARLNGHQPNGSTSSFKGVGDSNHSSNSSLTASSGLDSHNSSNARGPSQYMADYSSKLLDFFMSSDKTVIPAALLHPQRGPHINQPIDDEGNTAFHWTCAIGRIEVMQALVDAGASIHALNNAGQKPLVRAVLFTNNYEARSFPKVLEMLAETANFVDASGRTILHHIAGASSSGTRSSSARYYAEILLAKLTASPEIVGHNIAAFVNQQDLNGDTALHICGRSNAKRLAKVLLSYNALPNIPNKAGVTPEETFHKVKAAAAAAASVAAQHNSNSSSAAVAAAAAAAAAGAVEMGAGSGAGRVNSGGLGSSAEDGSLSLNQSKAVAYASKASKAISAYLAEFAKSYEKDLANKDSDIDQVQDLLNQIRQRISDTEALLPQLETEAGSEHEVAQSAEKLELEAEKKAQSLRHLLERSQARDLALLVQKEETDVQDELKEEIKNSESINPDEQFALAETLADLQRRRSTILDEIIVLYGNSGSREKIKKYRKLLAMCCEVSEDEVDGLLDGITQALST